MLDIVVFVINYSVKIHITGKYLNILAITLDEIQFNGKTFNPNGMASEICMIN